MRLLSKSSLWCRDIHPYHHVQTEQVNWPKLIWYLIGMQGHERIEIRAACDVCTGDAVRTSESRQFFNMVFIPRGLQ